MSMAEIAVLIPAYNEAGRIGKVLSALKNIDALSEIIVIDDGSQDSTAGEVRRASQVDGRIRLLQNSTNLGKGQSLYAGLNFARADLILMLDADLIGLQPLHVTDLIQPLITGSADMTVGVFRGGHWFTDLAHRVTPWLSGQRCLRRRLFMLLPQKVAAGYGFETAITVTARRYHLPVQKIALHGVTHPPNEVHRGFWKGMMNRIYMYTQILVALFLASIQPKVKDSNQP
jgi:glycosyltransferase involved in cell wall biosynthesis